MVLLTVAGEAIVANLFVHNSVSWDLLEVFPSQQVGLLAARLTASCCNKATFTCWSRRRTKWILYLYDISVWSNFTNQISHSEWSNNAGVLQPTVTSPMDVLATILSQIRSQERSCFNGRVELGSICIATPLSWLTITMVAIRKSKGSRGLKHISSILFNGPSFTKWTFNILW